jgi:hypothetical protein
VPVVNDSHSKHRRGYGACGRQGPNREKKKPPTPEYCRLLSPSPSEKPLPFAPGSSFPLAHVHVHVRRRARLISSTLNNFSTFILSSSKPDTPYSVPSQLAWYEALSLAQDRL